MRTQLEKDNMVAQLLDLKERIKLCGTDFTNRLATLDFQIKIIQEGLTLEQINETYEFDEEERSYGVDAYHWLTGEYSDDHLI